MLLKKNAKKICVVFFMSFVLVSYAQTEVDEKEIVIDVRTEMEYNNGHLKNAINIPHTEIKEKIKNHVKDKEKKIILYCRSGRRSGIAERILKEMGYKNVINAGAYVNLKKKEKEKEKQENQKEK